MADLIAIGYPDLQTAEQAASARSALLCSRSERLSRQRQSTGITTRAAIASPMPAGDGCG